MNKYKHLLFGLMEIPTVNKLNVSFTYSSFIVVDLTSSFMEPSKILTTPICLILEDGAVWVAFCNKLGSDWKRVTESISTVFFLQ